jgi:hypothetical protein
VLDGEISADGAAGNGSLAGSGSGGTVNIDIQALAGTGLVHARGGAGEVGGGGGRIAIARDPAQSDISQLESDAEGGAGSNVAGQPGTVHIEP